MFRTAGRVLLPSCFVLILGVIGCGGSSTVSSAPVFSLAATPGTLSLTPGGSGQAVTLSATGMDGFTGPVSVAITGLPAGVTANPASLTVTPGTTQTVTLAASASAVAATAAVTFTGTSGTSSKTATVALTVSAPPPPPDFSLSLQPAALSLTAGGAGGQVSVLATAANSFSGTVAVAITGLPAGVTANPATLNLTPGTAQSTTLTASASAASATPSVTFTGTSGSLSHSATLALTIAAPPPDFSLSLQPAALTLTAGGVGGSVNVLATPANAFSGTVAIAITGLPNGVTANPATLSLTPGTAQSTTLTASAPATAGTPSVTFTGTSGSLSHDAALALTVQAAAQTNAPDVTTYHNDNSRDGLNANETILTPANVNSTQFGKIAFDAVDGLVDAEPLYVANLIVKGKLRNVLYIVTEHDSVFAFDADTGSQLWTTSVLASGETTVPNTDVGSCGQISPELGITSTPVIDRKQGDNGTIFTVGMSKDASGAYHQRLHALDLTTGAETTGSPAEITATYPGSGDNSKNGKVVFDPKRYAERSALLLSRKNIYLTWTSHCDQRPYTGWVMAYGESDLKQTQVLNLTPNGNDGSVWMSGNGPAADSDGNVYLLDANGTFDLGFDGNGFPTEGDFGNAIVKMGLNSAGILSVLDFFEPFNTDDETTHDQDLGAGGELLLPDLIDSGGKTRHLIVGAGKDKHIYLADRDNLGKFNSKTSDNNNIYQDVSGALSGGVFSSPAYFNGSLYYAAVGDVLKALPLNAAKLSSATSSQSAAVFDYPGATPSISASGTANGIVWALESGLGKPAVLHAYDATNLTNELYNSGQAQGDRDGFGNGNKFLTPMIVNGKVYAGTPTGVAVFGLLSK